MSFLEIVQSVCLFAVPISITFMRSLSIKIHELRGDKYARYSPLETSIHIIPIPLFLEPTDDEKIITLKKKRNIYVYAVYSSVVLLVLVEILKQILDLS